EPTNHLDLASREMLEHALMQFGGALVFISHDRFFINRLATKVVHVESGMLRDYPGGFDDYERTRRAEARDDSEAPSSDDATPGARKARRKALAEVRERRRAASKDLRKRVEALEQQ